MKQVKLLFACNKFSKLEKTDSSNFDCTICKKQLIDYRTANNFSSLKVGDCGVFPAEKIEKTAIKIVLGSTQFLTLSLFTLLGFPTSLNAQQKHLIEKNWRENNIQFPLHFKGIVRDAKTKKGIQNASILLNEILFSQTNTAGEFNLVIQKNDFKNQLLNLQVQKDGFSTHVDELKFTEINEIKSNLYLIELKEYQSYVVEETTGIIAEPPLDIVSNMHCFSIVEQMPEFPGGGEKLFDFIKETMVYPKIALDNDVQGKVIMGFIVDEEGCICNIEVKKGVAKALDLEAIRIISSIPTWKPGLQQGKKVKVKYVIPVVFRLP